MTMDFRQDEIDVEPECSMDEACETATPRVGVSPRAAGIVGYAMLGLACLFVVITLYMAWWGWQLQSKGRTAEARIIGHQRTREHNTNGSTIDRYKPRYRFVDDQGIEHRVLAKSSSSKKRELGEAITVRYLPGDAENAVPDAFAHVWLPVCVAGPIALACAGLGGLGVRHARQHAGSELR